MSTCNLGILLATIAIIGLTNDWALAAEEKIDVLILDGTNPYHDWQTTTPLLQRIFRESGRFNVEIATAPDLNSNMENYRPRLTDYDVVLCNYGDQRPWSKGLRDDFVKFVRDGGGFVCFHSAANAFANWPEYNDICGLGGWYGRDEKWGPYAYFRDDKLVRDPAPGRTGHHGPQHEYAVDMRDLEHPITRGLPPIWRHTKDELYDSMRGKSEDLHVLATAYSDPEHEGTGRHEPLLVVHNYGEGRVFQTLLGHADYSMKCVGFITTLLRGTEWAATGEVTIPVPEDFPTAEAMSWRN